MTTGQDEIYYYGTGRRKTSVARVRVYSKEGGITVNRQPIEDVFDVDEWLHDALRPLEETALRGRVTVLATTSGGGLHGQATAFSHGLARALVKFDPNLRSPLKAAKLLTRDSRMRESKKYGLKRARKAPQYTKR